VRPNTGAGAGPSPRPKEKAKDRRKQEKRMSGDAGAGLRKRRVDKGMIGPPMDFRLVPYADVVMSLSLAETVQGTYSMLRHMKKGQSYY
jgi:hypothetical protein